MTTEFDSVFRQVDGAGSGHWGFVQTCGNEQSLQCVVQSLVQSRAVTVFHFTCESHQGIRESSSNEIFEVGKFEETLAKLRCETDLGQHDVIRCVFSAFEKLSLDQQCLLLRLSRSARESTSANKIQTIVVGAWNLFEVQRKWKSSYSNLSPVPDRNHVFFLPETDEDSVVSILRQAGLVSQFIRNIERVSVRAILELTSGEHFLINYFVVLLRKKGIALEGFESVIEDVADSGEVLDVFLGRFAVSCG